MTEEKTYTSEQLSDADELGKVLANIPQERKHIVTLLTSAFISGMETQAQLRQTTVSTSEEAE